LTPFGSGGGINSLVAAINASNTDPIHGVYRSPAQSGALSIGRRHLGPRHRRPNRLQ
jgi:hypothetical protein